MRPLLLISLTLLFQLAQAAPAAKLTPAVDRSAPASDKLKTLAASPLWLDLLHFNQGGTWRSRGESYVDDAKFFLAKNGSSNALAELQADVTAFQAPADKTRCHFPARYRFLASELGWQQPAPFAACTDYLAWRARVPDQQVVLAFPAAYLNSPSSMFGHVFLRLDPKVHPDAVLESWAVSFAADTNATDGSFAYAFKGIVGSYPGYFSVTPYGAKLLTYSHLENRDIWEYRLNLTPAETARLVDHLWELRQTRFGYYFFDENCAYRLLELVQVARPSVPLLTQLRLAEAPVAAVRELEQKGFIDSRHYRPSKEVSLRWQAAQLPSSQQKLAKRLAGNPVLAQTPAFADLDLHTRFAVASLAYDYQRYRHRVGARDKVASAHAFALLRLIHANSPAAAASTASVPAVPAPTPPDLGHADHLLAASIGQRDDVAFTDIEWRYTYHDLLDNSAGFLKGAEIKGLDLTLRSYVNQPEKRPGAGLRLQSLQLVDIRSLAARDRFVKPISWFVDGGIERVEAGRERLARYLQGGPGLAWQAGHFRPYVFLKARLENNSAYAQFATFGGGSELGALYYHGRLSAQIATSGLYFTNDDWRSRSRLGLNWALARNDALRVKVTHERYRDLRINEWSLAWRHYF